MKIYIDLIIFQDTVIMSLILFVFNKLLNTQIKMIRILIVSLISSMLSIITLIYLPDLYDNFLIKLLFSYFVVKFGLNIKSNEDVVSRIILFWLITFLFGGIGFALEGRFFQMFIVFLFVIIVILNFNQKRKKILLLDAATCFVEFEYKGMMYNLKSLVDTGHDVKTMYDEDVIFVKNNLLNIDGGDIKNKRIVSYKTVSGTEKKIGIKVYNINIIYGERKTSNNAVIVSTPNILNQFDAIVGLNLIEGGLMNGNITFNETEGKKIVS